MLFEGALPSNQPPGCFSLWACIYFLPLELGLGNGWSHGRKLTADVPQIDGILWRLSTLFSPLRCVGTCIAHVIHSSHFDFSPTPSLVHHEQTRWNTRAQICHGTRLPANSQQPSIVVCHWSADCKALWWSQSWSSAHLFLPCTCQPCAFPWLACCCCCCCSHRWSCYWLSSPSLSVFLCHIFVGYGGHTLCECAPVPTQKCQAVLVSQPPSPRLL